MALQIWSISNEQANFMVEFTALVPILVYSPSPTQNLRKMCYWKSDYKLFYFYFLLCKTERLIALTNNDFSNNYL